MVLCSKMPRPVPLHRGQDEVWMQKWIAEDDAIKARVTTIEDQNLIRIGDPLS